MKRFNEDGNMKIYIATVSLEDGEEHKWKVQANDIFHAEELVSAEIKNELKGRAMVERLELEPTQFLFKGGYDYGRSYGINPASGKGSH